MLISLHRAVLVTAISVALLATGFGHRMPTAAEDQVLAFAVQNGIAMSDLCGGDLDGSAHQAPDCQACQISGSADVPPVARVRIDVELAFHAAVIAPQDVRGAARPSDPAHLPQGPPVA